MALRRHGRRPYRGQPIGLLAALLGVRPAPRRERVEDVRWGAVDLGETSGDRTGVEVGGVDVVGVQSGGAHEPEGFESGEIGLEVVDQHPAVVEPELTGLVHVAVDRRGVVVLHDELDHRVAEVAERVGHIRLVIGPAVVERIGPMMLAQHEGAGTEESVPLADRCVEVLDEEGLLEEVVPIGRHTEVWPAVATSIEFGDARFPIDSWRIHVEPFDLVELAHRVEEHVDHDVAVVDERPLLLAYALGSHR